MPQLSAQGPIGFAFPTSEIRTSAHPDWTSGIPPTGQRARDPQGNEYLLVKFTDINYYGGWVKIDSSYNASRVGAATAKGPLGVCMRTVAVSDYGWVMIYGAHPAAQVTDSAGDSTFMLVAGKTDTEPSMTNVTLADSVTSVALAVQVVIGATISGAADSNATIASGAVVSDAVSSAYSGTFSRVLLNYPYLTGLTGFARQGTT